MIYHPDKGIFLGSIIHHYIGTINVNRVCPKQTKTLLMGNLIIMGQAVNPDTTNQSQPHKQKRWPDIVYFLATWLECIWLMIYQTWVQNLKQWESSWRPSRNILAPKAASSAAYRYKLCCLEGQPLPLEPKAPAFWRSSLLTLQYLRVKIGPPSWTILYFPNAPPSSGNLGECPWQNHCASLENYFSLVVSRKIFFWDSNCFIFKYSLCLAKQIQHSNFTIRAVIVGTFQAFGTKSCCFEAIKFSI